MAQQQQYKTYEDIVGTPMSDQKEKVDFKHGRMFNLPEGFSWWTARDAWGKPVKKDDPLEHFIDVRFLGFIMDNPDVWPKTLQGRMGGLNYTFPLLTHKDPNEERHLCLERLGGACPRCQKFFDTREETRDMADSRKAWDIIKVWAQRYSGIVCGYVGGDTSKVRVFEFSDTKPGKGFDKDPTFFQRIVTLCTDKSVPVSSRLNPCFYAYDNRAQVLRLKFRWTEKQAGKGYWQLGEIFKVTQEDGAPSADADPQLAYKIKPWEWLDVEGERKRMLENDGEKAASAPDFDKMDYAGLMAFAMENQLSSVLEDGYQENETDLLRKAVKMEVSK